MDKAISNLIIIWGSDNFNTLGVLRQLGGSNLNILFLIKGHKGVASKSVYCRRSIVTNSIIDGYNYLIANYSDEQHKPIIITSCDDIITFIDQHRNKLEHLFILPGTNQQGVLEKVIDKNNMTQLAMDIGINCPASKFVKWDSSLENIIFPCILKPGHEKPGFYNEFKSQRCDNIQILKNTLKLVRKDSEFILQQYIPKEQEALIYGARMMTGNVVLAGAFIKDRLLKSGPGSHGILTNNIPQCIDTLKISEFLEKIDYYGLFSFEYGIQNNKSYFFEVNLRNDGTSHYFYQAGANIPLAYVYSCVGLDYSHIPTKIQTEGTYIDEVYGVEDILTGKVSLKQWKKEKTEANVFRYYSIDDVEPWKYVMGSRWSTIMKNLIVPSFRIYIVRILEKIGLRK